MILFKDSACQGISGIICILFYHFWRTFIFVSNESFIMKNKALAQLDKIDAKKKMNKITKVQNKK